MHGDPTQVTEPKDRIQMEDSLFDKLLDVMPAGYEFAVVIVATGVFIFLAMAGIALCLSQVN